MRLLLVTLCIYLVNSASIKKQILYIAKNEISDGKVIMYPLKIENNFGFLKLDKVYLIQGNDYICPAGYMTFAYQDQQGNFRIASSNFDEDSSSTDISRAILLENCEKSGNKHTKNYMKGTISSNAKINKNSKPFKMAPMFPKHYDSSTTTRFQNYEQTTAISELRQSDSPDHLLTNDFSLIESDEADFPAYMFNDKGDAIYGSGLAVTIFAAIMGFIKMLRENKALFRQLVSAKKSLDEFLKADTDQGKKTPTTSDTTPPRQSTLSDISSLNSTRQNNTVYTTAKVNESKEANNDTTSITHQSTSLHSKEQQPVTVNIHMPPSTGSQQINTDPNIPKIFPNLLLSPANIITHNQDESDPCTCQRGNCISGHCKCRKNRRVCTDRCHSGRVNA